uniref:CSON001403 protein n=1 Tax=Culicoides sonorensis TaxID=179676 RepID=A0A336MGJ2_CULSO
MMNPSSLQKTISNRLSLIITLFMTVNCFAEQCGQEELAKCASSLEKLQSSSDLSIAKSKEELDILCPDLNQGLHCIRSYTRRCMTLTQRDHFNKLYHGTAAVIKDLCNVGKYQDEFLQHSPCLDRVRNSYEICARQYQNTMALISQGRSSDVGDQTHNDTRNEADDVRNICCSFRQYLDCSQHAARRECGESTGRFIRDFLDRMGNSLIKMYCTEYQLGTEKCYGYSSKGVVVKSIENLTVIFSLEKFTYDNSMLIKKQDKYHYYYY